MQSTLLFGTSLIGLIGPRVVTVPDTADYQAVKITTLDFSATAVTTADFSNTVVATGDFQQT